MADRPTRIIFFGNERLATGVTTTAPTLQRLIDAGYNVAAVVSHHSQSRSRKDRQLEIAEVADAHGIPVLLPEKPAEIIETLRVMKADIAVLVAYGKIVPQSVIDIFPRGIINIHPSRLPLHRGPTPVESVILEGAATTAVSVMELAAAMDAGPVYGQSDVALQGDETKQQLADSLLEAGGDLLVSLLPRILDGSLASVEQDDTAATYDRLITKQDGVIDPGKPAVQLAREVRAYLGWPGSRMQIGNLDVIVTAAHAEPISTATPDTTSSSRRLAYETADGLFVIDRLKPAGKASMSAQAFLAGYSGRF